MTDKTDFGCELLDEPLGQRNLKVTVFRRDLKPQVESDVVSDFVRSKQREDLPEFLGSVWAQP